VSWKLNIVAIIVENISSQKVKEYLLLLVLIVAQMMSGIFRKKGKI
jgi:hypothetical protein